MPGFSFPGGFFPGGDATGPSGPTKPVVLLLSPASSTSTTSLFVQIPGKAPKVHGPTVLLIVVDRTTAELHPNKQTAELHGDKTEAAIHPNTTTMVVDNYG